jgi:succinoglycan biosynthesis transport protein ExoP
MTDSIPNEDSADPWGTKVLDIWKRRNLLGLAVVVVPLAAALSVAVSLPNVYRSAALVEVTHEGPADSTQDANAATEAQLQQLTDENLSRSNLQQMITRFDLYPQVRAKGEIEGAIAQMRRDAKVEITDQQHTFGRQTASFSVSFRGSNPTLVSQVANSLADFYVKKSQEQDAARTKSEVSALSTQLDETKARMDTQQKQVSEFIAAHLQELPEQERVNLAAIDRLNAQLASLTHRRAASIEPARDIGAPVSATAEDPQAVELARLKAQLEALRGQATDEHPDVKRLKQEIAVLSAQAAHQTARPTQAVVSDAALAGAQPAPTEEPQAVRPRESTNGSSAQIRAQISAIEQKVYNSPMREQELQTLLAPLSVTRQLYASLSEKLENAQRLQSSHAMDPFRILDPAVPSRDPAGPARLKLVAAGLVVSLLLALLVMLLAEKLDTSFHSVEELRAWTRVPILASVPNIVVAKDAEKAFSKTRWAVVLVAVLAAIGAFGIYVLVHNNETLVWMLSHGRA